MVPNGYSFAARPSRIDYTEGTGAKLMLEGVSFEEFNEVTGKVDARESRLWVPAGLFFTSSAEQMGEAVFEVKVRRVC